MAGSDAPFDRAVVVAGIWRAIRGSQTDRVQLVTMAAAAGARQANAERSLASLIAEIDGLERMIYAKFGELGDEMSGAAASRALSGVAEIHDCCARMRAAATAGFSHGSAIIARRRTRAARHDIVNNIGTVRNAILLMDDEPDAAAREHFRAIAKRNSVTSEQLVRSHLSEEAACQGAAAASATDAERVVAGELDTCADREYLAETATAIRALAALVGITVVEDGESGRLEISRSASSRNQRYDLGRACERENSDTVGL